MLHSSRRVSYEIDVKQTLRFPHREPVVQRAAVSLSAEFIVATNNYRASGGGNFPGLDGTKTIFASPDTNREVLISYLKTVKTFYARCAWQRAKLALCEAPARLAQWCSSRRPAK